MKKYCIRTIISVMVFWGVYSPAVALSAEDNQSFLDMINVIRNAPYDYARGLEYTHEDLIAKGIDSDTHFKPYTRDEGLTATAEDESQKMAWEKISESEETDPPVYRFAASTGGVVSFFNFMPRDTAFKIVIDYLFKNELKTNTFDYILSEDYSAAGIGISAGKVGSGNAWFVAIRLRSSELVSEIQILNLINQARANPDNIGEYEYNNIKLNQTELYQNPNINDLFAVKYKPLFFDAALSASASEIDLVETDVYYHGYNGEVVRDSEVPIPYKEESGRSVDFLFFSLLSKELTSWPINYVVFSNDIQDVGSSITFPPSDNQIDDSILSFVVGKSNPNSSNEDENSSSDNDPISRIYGVLFSDDGDELYSPGEEIIQQTVTAYDDERNAIEAVTDTDNAGHFYMELKSNRQYRFESTIDDVLVSWDNENTFITSDQFVKLGYSPPPLEDDLLTVDLQ